MNVSPVVDPRLERRFRLAGSLLLGGLAVDAATFGVTHPLAFLAFAGIGTTAVVAGVLLYLHAIVSYR